MAVDDEMQVTDAVHLDRRNRLTSALGQRQPLPSLPDTARGGPEVPVEVAPGIYRAHHGIQPDRLQPQRPLPGAPQRRDHLVEGQDEVDVIGLTAQPAGQPGQDLAAPGTQERVLDIGPRESGLRHGIARPASRRRPWYPALLARGGATPRTPR
jgi:hypothetical protein